MLTVIVDVYVSGQVRLSVFSVPWLWVLASHGDVPSYHRSAVVLHLRAKRPLLVGPAGRPQRFLQTLSYVTSCDWNVFLSGELTGFRRGLRWHAPPS